MPTESGQSRTCKGTKKTAPYRDWLGVEVEERDEDLPDEELCVELGQPRAGRLEDAIEQISAPRVLHHEVQRVLCAAREKRAEGDERSVR